MSPRVEKSADNQEPSRKCSPGVPPTLPIVKRSDFQPSRLHGEDGGSDMLYDGMVYYAVGCRLCSGSGYARLTNTSGARWLLAFLL